MPDTVRSVEVCVHHVVESLQRLVQSTGLGRDACVGNHAVELAVEICERSSNGRFDLFIMAHVHLIPAFGITMSKRPKSARTSRVVASMAALLVTLHLYALNLTPYWAKLSVSSFMASGEEELYVMAMSAPASARPIAAPRPIPREPPVMKATLPLREKRALTCAFAGLNSIFGPDFREKVPVFIVQIGFGGAPQFFADLA
ncbi:hypothetical protein OGATHE_001543 [Ogataea polymorpha]|uniref:Uncharacterized protein n=1 Tax=Ogataea polymorpha TaxID=460523 RepID=A0A9P8PPK5_9ASCO|nr:hypothetical protein OGATHE_001543 [Ogataea polymorpha]